MFPPDRTIFNTNLFFSLRQWQAMHVSKPITESLSILINILFLLKSSAAFHTVLTRAETPTTTVQTARLTWEHTNKQSHRTQETLSYGLLHSNTSDREKTKPSINYF